MLCLYLLALLVLAVLVIQQDWRRRNRAQLELAAKVPGPPTLPLFGNAFLFAKKPSEQMILISRLVKQYGQYVRFWLGLELNIVVSNPEDIKMLLSSRKVNQKGPVYEYLKALFGSGLLTGGRMWHFNRKVMTPSYSKRSVQQFSQVFNEEAVAMAEALSRKDPKQTFNIYQDAVDCCTQCVCQTLFGLTKGETKNLKYLDEVVEETLSIHSLLYSKATKWWFHIPLIFRLLGGMKTQNYYDNLIKNFSKELVEKRRPTLERMNDEEKNDLCALDRLVLYGDLPEQEKLLQIFTTFTTSQEPAGKIASGVFVFLAHLPEWQDKVYNEILEQLGPEDGLINEDQLKLLENLEAVYKEVIRYLPIGPLIQRTVEEEITIDSGNITMPKGTSLAIPLHVLHRDPRYWDEPEKPKPERFLPENSERYNPNAYVPFSIGAMDCLGRNFASTLVKTIVVKALRRVTFEADGCIEDLDIEVAISTIFSKGYNLRVCPRVTP